jgi:hypothetical protein
MGSLRLDRKERALIDGRGEPAIVPGNSAQSQLYRRISGARLGPQMPLTGALGAREIAVLKEWIDSGASWPDEPPPRRDWTADIRLNPLFQKCVPGCTLRFAPQFRRIPAFFARGAKTAPLF